MTLDALVRLREWRPYVLIVIVCAAFALLLTALAQCRMEHAQLLRKAEAPPKILTLPNGSTIAACWYAP